MMIGRKWDYFEIMKTFNRSGTIDKASSEMRFSVILSRLSPWYTLQTAFSPGGLNVHVIKETVLCWKTWFAWWGRWLGAKNVKKLREKSTLRQIPAPPDHFAQVEVIFVNEKKRTLGKCHRNPRQHEFWIDVRAKAGYLELLYCSSFHIGRAPSPKNSLRLRSKRAKSI
jgi:hypothetical protein